MKVRKFSADDAPFERSPGQDGDIFAAARTALTHNAQTFAMLPMTELLKPDGYLAALKAEGYQVEAPEDQDEDPASDSSAAAPASAGTAPE